MKSDINQSHGVYSGSAEIRFERLLPGPIERVWRYITDPEMRQLWLARGTGDPQVGGEIRYEFHNRELETPGETVPEKYRAHAGEGVGFTATVLRCEPPRLLSHTWGGEEEDPPSEVTFELTPEGDQVRLVLTHSRAAGPEQLLSVSGGWHVHLAVLVAKLEGSEPPVFWKTLSRVEEDYARKLSAA